MRNLLSIPKAFSRKYAAVLAFTPFLFNPVVCTAAVEPSFGFVGEGGGQFAIRFELPFYTLEGNYPAAPGSAPYSLDPAFDPPPGHSVVREVAKLDQRSDGLGETLDQFRQRLTGFTMALAVWYLTPSYLRGAKPVLAWYQPNAAALAAAEEPGILAAIRREKASNPQIAGTLWEIGNEPNMFPSLTPQEYALVFTAYYNIIKGEDASAQVGMGSLFLQELAPDLRPRMESVLEQEFETAMRAGGYYDALQTAGMYDAMSADVKNAVMGRIYAYTTPQYLAAALEALPAGVVPDRVTLHAYPYYNTAPAALLAALPGNAAAAFSGVLAVMAARPLPVRIWVTEFGNIQPHMAEGEAAAQADTLIGFFRGNASVEKWFYYKPVGKDRSLALFSDGADVITRLAADSNFVPADGGFSCDALNLIGRMYYHRSHGYICRDLPAGPLLASSPADTAHEEQRYLFRAQKTDTSLPLVYEFMNLPAWMSAAGDSAWGMPDDPVHDTLFRVISSINERADTLTVALTVVPVNDAPVIESLQASRDTVSETGTVEFTGSASDAEGDALAYVWVGEPGDTLGSGPAVVFSPGHLDAGTVSITLSVSDPSGAFDTASIRVTVLNVSIAPVILNAPGSEATPDTLLRWGWNDIRDPDLDTASVFYRIRAWSDSMGTVQAGAVDSMSGMQMPVSNLHLASSLYGKVFRVSVQAADGQGHVTGWSPLQPLRYMRILIRPIIFNVPGSEISPESMITWGWPEGVNPGLDEATIRACIFITGDSLFSDSIARRDSLSERLVPVDSFFLPDSLAGLPVWVRAKMYDSSGRSTDWGGSVKLFYTGRMVEAAGARLPAVFGLGANVPNPFVSGTRVPFAVPDAGGNFFQSVSLTVYTLQGKIVRRLADNRYPAGFHSAYFDGRDGSGNLLPGGLYLLMMRADRFQASAVLMKQ